MDRVQRWLLFLGGHFFLPNTLFGGIILHLFTCWQRPLRLYVEWRIPGPHNKVSFLDLWDFSGRSRLILLAAKREDKTKLAPCRISLLFKQNTCEWEVLRHFLFSEFLLLLHEPLHPFLLIALKTWHFNLRQVWTTMVLKTLGGAFFSIGRCVASSGVVLLQCLLKTETFWLEVLLAKLVLVSVNLVHRFPGVV